MNCLKENTHVYVPIEEIIEIEKDIIIFKVASITIQASKNHLFDVFEKGLCRAEEIKLNDCLAVELSLLKSGDKVLSSEGSVKIKNICYGYSKFSNY